jgi:hypothetical protein
MEGFSGSIPICVVYLDIRNSHHHHFGFAVESAQITPWFQCSKVIRRGHSVYEAWNK